MASFGNIPELVKTMYSLFGEKWGRRIGRAIVIFILVATCGVAIVALGSGFNSISNWITNLKPPATTLFVTILSAIILFVGLFAVGAIIYIAGALLCNFKILENSAGFGKKKRKPEDDDNKEETK